MGLNSSRHGSRRAVHGRGADALVDGVDDERFEGRVGRQTKQTEERVVPGNGKLSLHAYLGIFSKIARMVKH